MFGFDKLVKIGTLNASGDFEIDLSANPAENLSKEDYDTFISRLSYGFQYGCGNPDDFPEGEPKINRLRCRIYCVVGKRYLVWNTFPSYR